MIQHLKFTCVLCMLSLLAKAQTDTTTASAYDTIKTKYDNEAYFKKVSNLGVGKHFWYSPSYKFRKSNEDGIYLIETPYSSGIDQGLIKNSKREGRWYMYNDSGMVIIREFKRGSLHGFYFEKTCSDTKAVTTKHYKRGKIHGTYRTEHPNGEIKYLANYRRGKLKHILYCDAQGQPIDIPNE